MSGLAAVPAAAAAAPVPEPSKVSAAAESTKSQQARASIQARKTGKPVIVDSLTTPTSMTVADPKGGFVLTQSPTPTRVQQHGLWRNLDATLLRNSDGTFSPGATTSALTLSSGGSGPLAVMTTAGRTLSISWPAKLPAPVVSGATATYPSVLPGVDLVVTATKQGGFSDVLVVKTRQAAANPALAQLRMATHGSDGLTVTADKDGVLQAKVSQDGVPLFTAPVPVMWDSATTAPLPAKKQAPATGSAGGAAVVSGPPGRSLTSTAAEPGSRAHTARIKTTAERVQVLQQARGSRMQSSDGTITLTPDPSMLANSSTVFPVYIDPGWLPSGGTRATFASTDDYYANTNYYNSTADPSPQKYLQVGYDGQFNAHSFVQMNLSAIQLAGAVVNSASISFTEETSYSCTPSPVELWWTGAITNPISWNQEPAWLKWTGAGAAPDGAIASVNAAHGYSGCSPAGVGFDLTSFMKTMGPKGLSNVTFGLKAPDTNTASEWKEFDNGANTITMTTYYDHAPNPPGYAYTSPGGACQNGVPGNTVVGNDDLTLQIVPSDYDGGQLTTRFVVLPYGGSTPVYDSAVSNTSVTTTSGQVAQITIPRTTVQGTSWGHSDGATAPYSYSWYTVVSDGLLDNSSRTDLGTKTKPCNITYNPTGPQAPKVTPPAGISGSPDAAVGYIGDTPSFTFAECATATTGCTGTLPVSYTYQINDGPPSYVSVTGATQSVPIPLTHVGPNTLTVTGVSAGGNPGKPFPITFNVDAAKTPYADADFNNAGHPDLLTVGNTATATSNPGLWVAPSDGNGNLATPTDFGARGTGISSGSPSDWNGTQVLHGNFALNNVQDVVAYYPQGPNGANDSNYPQAGNLQLLNGGGDLLPLVPNSGGTQSLSQVLGDNAIDGGTDQPVQLVAAGNASLSTTTGLPDLIGILGDGTHGYELNLYSATRGNFFSQAYGDPNNPNALTHLATKDQSPEGAGGNWANFTLATAQPSGHTVLFALDRAKGNLWESTNPNQSTTALIGSHTSTWTPITAATGTTWPWAANTGPKLVQADVSGGNIELWTVNATNQATVYTLPISGNTITKGVTTSLTAPTHEWPLTDGATSTSGQATLADTQAASNAIPNNGVSWSPADPTRGIVANLDASKQQYITLPQGMLQNSTNAPLQSMTVSLSFKANPGKTGILLSTGASNPDAATPSSSFVPVMYIGTDGKLYAQFWTGQITPLVSPHRVTDSQWHTATLVADGVNADQLLYLDSDVPLHIINNAQVTSPPPTIINPATTSTAFNVYAGGGIFNTFAWTNADTINGSAGTTRASYFTGQISDIAFYTQTLSMNQLKPRNIPTSMTGTINAAVPGNKCLDDWQASTTNGNKIDIYTCNNLNNGIAQRWTLNPNATITLTSQGGTGNNGSGVCLDIGGDHHSSQSPLFLWTCNNSPTQQWEVLSDGSLANPASGDCIDDPNQSTTDGTQLQIYGCNGSPAQTWISVLRTTPTTPIGTIVNARAGLCVNNAGGTSTSTGPITNGNPIQMATCSGFPSQQWTFQPDSTITIGGKCLDITGAVNANGTKIQLTTCNGLGYQNWAADTDGSLWNPKTGRCLDAGPGTAGTQLQIWDCNQTSAQVFTIP